MRILIFIQNNSINNSIFNLLSPKYLKSLLTPQLIKIFTKTKKSFLISIVFIIEIDWYNRFD